MRHITITLAALAALGLSGGLASAQGQGQSHSGGDDKGREQARGSDKQEREAQIEPRPQSGSQRSDMSGGADPVSAGGGDNRQEIFRGSERARTDDDTGTMRDQTSASAVNEPAGRGPSGNSERSRGGSNDNADGGGNAPAATTSGETRDRPNSRRTVAKRNPFQFVQSDYFIRGCPRGRAIRNNNCLPPGQDAQRPLLDYGADFFGFRALQDRRYRYGNGYLYGFSETGDVLGFVPLLGGALSIGNPWPRSYQRNQVPDYFAEYYNLGPPRNYGYANDVIYRLNPQSSAITSIAALLTGDEFRVGERVPEGYDIYNVPTTYRDQYRDTPDAAYRYSDGYVYEIDPATQLVRAAIELLA